MSSERAQPIRPTQFVTTYGVGAILESLRGPCLIKSIATSELFTTESPVDYEIVEPSLRAILPEGSRIFRLPTNAERDLEDSVDIYRTQRFPGWSLCTQHGVLYRPRIDEGRTCPRCPKLPKWKAWEQAGLQAVSFVFACQGGHLDDVPWVRLVHEHLDCKPEYLEWRGTGGPLRGVTIVCPKCGSMARLSDLYHKEHACSGRFPETGETRSGACTRRARLTQRGASDLFLPEVRTALTLPVVDTPLMQAMRHDVVAVLLESKVAVKGTLEESDWLEITAGRRVPDSIRELIMASSLGQRNQAAEVLMKEESPSGAAEARSREFSTLRLAARGQAPTTPHFEVDHVGSREFSLGPYTLRVTPVSRLRMVAAQTGYTRLSGEVVDTAYEHLGNSWYPGVELYGEGLFLEVDEELDSRGPVFRRWQQRHEVSGQACDHPVTVWWHTLSHRLIRGLAVDSGYSAAAVRERLYVEDERGGLLLYAVQPGGDGTLGGLIALVPRFDRLLNSALRHVDGCSNDPLCSEQSVGPARQSGAACYACSLLSETSCEMRNLSLDRNILIETLLI